MCDLHQDEERASTRTEITELVDELTVALTNARIYAREHPRVQASIASLARCLEGLARDDDAEPVVLGTAEGFLFYKRKPLLGASLSNARVIEALRACHAGGLQIDRRVGLAELLSLVDLLAAHKKGYAGLQEANADLEQRGCRSVRLLPEYRGGNFAVGTQDPALRAVLGEHEVEERKVTFEVPLELYQQTVALLQDAAMRACHGQELDLARAKGFVESILARLSRDAVSMMGIARYERHDAYTFGHSIRVCFLALNFAATLFERPEVLLRIGVASLLHDIGKARVPFEVLHSTTRLTPDERAEMNQHTLYGGEILLGLADADPLAVSTAFGHHQTLDGAGYPHTLHPVRQSIGTRIIKICDVYEALTAVRPYKPRMSPVRAYRIMISMKNHFDPVLLRRFIAVNGIYPVGSLVRLSSGEQARVLEQTAEPLAPRVRLEQDERGAPLGRGPELVRDLSAEEPARRPRIVALVEKDLAA